MQRDEEKDERISVEERKRRRRQERERESALDAGLAREPFNTGA